MWLLIIALIALAALFALAVVIRDVGRELASLEAKRGGAEGAETDAEEGRARDEAFQQFNNLNEVP